LKLLLLDNTREIRKKFRGWGSEAGRQEWALDGDGQYMG
jgi:hypothetical protein